jgi:hypothetical protein
MNMTGDRPMTDPIRETWLEKQFEEGMKMAQRSSIVSLAPIAGEPPFKYIAKFECDGLMESVEGITVCNRHVVGIFFPEHYQRVSCDPGEVLTWLEPHSEFHPNIRPPFCCVGNIAPGMSLLSLLQQLYTMITWQRFTPREDDALNKEACRWAREHLERFPIDRRLSMLGAGSSADANRGQGHE